MDDPIATSPDDTADGLGRLELDLDRHLSVSDQVHGVLRRAILDIRLPPDTRISENAICRQFAVSRTPVRAAIQRLAEEGLVDVSPQRGSFVAPLHLSHVRDCHFVRRELELALLRETARIWTPEMSATLRDVIEEQSRVIAARDLEGVFREDDRFHRILAGYAGRKGVLASIDSAKIAVSRFYRCWATLPRLSDVLVEHSAVLDALDQGDAGLAEVALRSHLDMVFVIFEQMPEDRKRSLPFNGGADA